MNFTLSTSIAATPEKVFAFLTNIDLYPKAIKAIVKIEKLTDGPVGLGTRFKETRKMGMMTPTEEFAFIHFDPPNAYTLEVNSCGCVMHYAFSVVPKDAGSELTLNMSTKSLSFFAKLMSPLSKLMAGTMKKCVADDLDQIKTAIERSV